MSELPLTRIAEIVGCKLEEALICTDAKYDHFDKIPDLETASKLKSERGLVTRKGVVGVRFKKHEDEYLIQNYKKHTIDDLAKGLDRTYQSVAGRLKKLREAERL